MERFVNDFQNAPEMMTASTELRIGGQRIALKLAVPTAEVPPETLLPSLQELSNRIVGGVEEKVARHGLAISCRKGCGACCRQHVPISPAEARLLSVIVDNMPEDARTTIRERFERAARRLEESGIKEQALNYHMLSEKQVQAMVHSYFRLGIPCPFLEDESCSIHPFRPLVCREYLVISPPDHCATLAEDQIKRLQFPVSIAATFAEQDGMVQQGENPYIPLILALEWTEAHGQDIELRPGPEWLTAFFEDLSGTEIPHPVLPGRTVAL